MIVQHLLEGICERMLLMLFAKVLFGEIYEVLYFEWGMFLAHENLNVTQPCNNEMKGNQPASGNIEVLLLQHRGVGF